MVLGERSTNRGDQGHGRHRVRPAGREVQGQFWPTVPQEDHRRPRKKTKEPKLSRRERRVKSKAERLERRRQAAIEARVAVEVFEDLRQKGENYASTLTAEKGRSLSGRNRRKATVGFIKGALDGYDVVTINPATPDVLDKHQLEKAHKRIIERGDNVDDLIERLGDLTSLATKIEALDSQSESWTKADIKAALSSARKYYRNLSRPQKRAFDEHAHIPSAMQEWMYTGGLTGLAFGLGDGLAALTGAGTLLYFKANEYPDARIATVMTAVAYLSWVSAIVGLSAKANADMIEAKGFSTDPIAKMMWNYGERRGYSLEKKKKLAKRGFIITECLIKELPWIIGIPTLSALVEFTSPEGQSTVSSLQEVFNNMTHGNFEYSDIATGALLGLAGAYAGGAAYELGNAAAIKLYLRRSRKRSRMHHAPREQG